MGGRATGVRILLKMPLWVPGDEVNGLNLMIWDVNITYNVSPPGRGKMFRIRKLRITDR